MRGAALHSRSNRRFGAALVVGIPLWAGLSRLPQLASPQLFACGDEAIVGLMAERVLSGDGLPLFFYGQSYMLAVVEVLSTSLALVAVGSSPLALKLGGLAAWTLGLVLFAIAARRLMGERAAILASVLFLCIPAWARVGQMYTGAFVISGLALWLIARLYAGRDAGGHSGSEGARSLTRFALGFVLLLLYFIHPLWLACVLPFLPLAFGGWAEAEPSAGRRGVAALAVTAAGVALGLVLILLAGADRGDYWSPPILQDRDVVESLARLPRRWFDMSSGHYFLHRTLPMGGVSALAAWLWTLASLAAMGAGGVVLARGGARAERPPHLPVRCLVGIAAVVAFSLVTNPGLFGPRYLLPATPLVVLLMAWALDRLRQRGDSAGWARRTAAVALGLLVLTGSASLYELRLVSPDGFRVHQEFPESRALEALLAQLAGRDIHHVYSTDPMLQWNIMFSASGPMRARWQFPTDRIPGHPQAVDRALWSGAPVAVVGRVRMLRLANIRALVASSDDAVLIEPHYFVRFDPTPRELERAGFRLNPRP